MPRVTPRSWCSAFLAATLGCSSERPAPSGEPAPSLASAPSLREQILASRSLPELLDASRDIMGDQHMPNRYAALQRREPCVDLVTEWSRSNLTAEALAEAPLVDVDHEVRRDGPIGGRAVCVEGRLRELRVVDDTAEFTIRDERGRVSGGRLVGVGNPLPELQRPVVVCGVLIGRRIQEDVVPKGVFVVGLLR